MGAGIMIDASPSHLLLWSANDAIHIRHEVRREAARSS